MVLTLVKPTTFISAGISPVARDINAENNHRQLIQGYLETHRIRNHAPETIRQYERFLEGWFSGQSEKRGEPLYTWQVMTRDVGRPLILDYAKTLRENDINTHTIRAHLNILKQYFTYVTKSPFVTFDGVPRRIEDLYGKIESPISEFDMPQHTCDFERLGVPIDPERAYDFLSILREHYLAPKSPIKSRNYCMAVLALESGLRIQELLHLEISKDLFFDSHKLQTRYAKGTKGSGKRSRITLFPPLSRDTVNFYLKHHRNAWPCRQKTDYLFLSSSGRLLTYSIAHSALCDMVVAARKINFPVEDHMTWHWFRRLFATRFIERFPDKLHILIELLGHIGAGTVHHYIRHSKAWIDEEIQDVLEKVGQWPSNGT